MKCDELKQVENPIEWGLYYNKAEVDEAIAELKHQVWEADERAIDAGATSHEKMQECENFRLTTRHDSGKRTPATGI